MLALSQQVTLGYGIPRLLLLILWAIDKYGKR
jgi:hypothetical protein